jgi:pilus assembly protein CpaC
MHRTNRVPYQATASLLVGLLLAGLSQTAVRAQAPQPVAPSASALIVPINGTMQIQMSTKKKIQDIVNTNERVARTQQVLGDPTKILVMGLEAGVTHVKLTDEDKKVEEFDVVVQQDVEFLRTQIKRAVPTANVEPIPVSGTTIILRGTVTHAEDVDAILGIARGLAGSQIVNYIKVAGVQQVQLCVTVAAVSRSEFRRMAFNFTISGTNANFGSLVGQALSLGANPAITAGTPITTGILGSPNGAQTNLFFTLSKSGTNLLTFLQALRDDNVVKLLAEPKLVTLSGRSASFLSGGEQAVPIPAGLGQVGVQFEEFGTRLNFLPVVLGGGKIHLEVEPEVSSLNAAFGTSIQGTVVPGRTTQRVHTTVEMEDGQTFVIGGLIQRDVVGSTSKVPILGELPFFGAAFSTKSFVESESELVILVTPHLVDPMACSQLVGKLLPGQETRSPDDFELFLEGILEAPRGQREITFPCGYQPAYKNGPTAGQFPCGVSGASDGLGLGCLTGRCGNGSATGGCATGGCSKGTPPIATDGTAPPSPSAPAVLGDEVMKPATGDDAVNSQPGSSSRPTVLPPMPIGAGPGSQP